MNNYLDAAEDFWLVIQGSYCNQDYVSFKRALGDILDSRTSDINTEDHPFNLYAVNGDREGNRLRLEHAIIAYGGFETVLLNVMFRERENVAYTLFMQMLHRYRCYANVERGVNTVGSDTDSDSS